MESKMCPLAGLHPSPAVNMPSGEPVKIVGKWGRVGVSQRGKPRTHTEQVDGPPAVSCLYSVMSRLSAVGLPVERDAIAEPDG